MGEWVRGWMDEPEMGWGKVYRRCCSGALRRVPTGTWNPPSGADTLWPFLYNTPIVHQPARCAPFFLEHLGGASLSPSE